MASSRSSRLLAILCVVALVDGWFISPQAENRIIGGHEIDISQVPWQVSLLLRNKHNCGGSIISRQWVLSAAHCTYPYIASELQIRIGSNSSLEGGKLYQVVRLVNHENYDNVTFFNDISVLMTKTGMDLDSFPVKSVTLPKVGAERPSGKLLVSGWGMTKEEIVSTWLMAVEVRVRESQECRTYGHFNEATHICAGSSSISFCHGDSGGPLVDGDLLVGIVSYMANETCALRAGTYTNVAFYRQWIETHTDV